MMDTLVQQVQWFALAVLLGIGFGAAFCVESLVGRLLRLRRTGQFALDVGTFLLCAAVSFLYLLTFRSGELRGYPLLGMACGAGSWFGLRRICRALVRRICPMHQFTKNLQKKIKKN